MAKIISVEKSKYINQNIEIYSQNKIGQYSKFLNKNPIFITYYSINSQQSRSDTGTGGIQKEYGPMSPMRFNKIKDLPIYNLPTINPDLDYDESGLDINIDLNDIIILPNTANPVPGDYLLLDFPGIKQFLFRVNNYKHNTIQSNDFYEIDLDIKEIGSNLEVSTGIINQIVQTYQTIFDNIGTQDKCFIIDTDVEKINALVRTMDVIKENYINLYYDKNVGSFMVFTPYLGTDCPVENRCNCMQQIYDPYLEKFINNTNLYYVNDVEESLLLVPADILPSDFDYLYSRSIWNALIRRNLEMYAPYMYYWLSRISKKYSPFNMQIRDADSVKLYMSNNTLDLSNPIDGSNQTYTNGGTYVAGTLTGEYFDFALIQQIKNKQLTSTDYIDKIIYNYFNNINETIDKDMLLQSLLNSSVRNFKYTPIVIYIINIYYNDYFSKTDSDII